MDLCSFLCFGFADFVLDFVLRICGFCARFCASDLRILCSILCFGFVDFLLEFVLRICGFCGRFCASDLRILCSILCFGFADFLLHFALRICRVCARICVSDLRILCSILCFGFADFVLDFVLRICGFLLDFVLRICGLCEIFCSPESNRQKSGARETRIWSTRNQEIFSPTQTTEIEVLVLPTLGSGAPGPCFFGAPGPWFWCSRPLVLVLQAPGRARNLFLGLLVIWLLNVESSS